MSEGLAKSGGAILHVVVEQVIFSYTMHFLSRSSLLFSICDIYIYIYVLARLGVIR